MLTDLVLLRTCCTNINHSICKERGPKRTDIDGNLYILVIHCTLYIAEKKYDSQL
jgi:hypothetical protein